MQQNKNDRLYKCVLYSKKESYIISYVLVKEMWQKIIGIFFLSYKVLFVMLTFESNASTRKDKTTK